MKKVILIQLLLGVYLVYAGNFEAVCVGINDLRSWSWPVLEYMEKDARDMRDMLYEQGFHNVITLIGSGADEISIKYYIEHMSQEEGDKCVFYFSGHGQRGYTYYGTQSYLATYNYPDSPQLLFAYELGGLFLTDNFSCIIEACYSGGFRTVIDDGVILTSCNDLESSIELEDLQHGLFTHFILEGMANNEADDSDNGNFVSVEELYSYSLNRVLARNSNQHVQLGDNFSGEFNLTVDSGSNLPPIPAETCHPFRFKPATHSGRNFTTYKAFSGMRKNVVYSKKI